MAQKYKEQRDIIDHEKAEIADKLSVEEFDLFIKF